MKNMLLLIAFLVMAHPVQAAQVPLAALGPEGLTVSAVVLRVHQDAVWLGDGSDEVKVRVNRLVPVEPALVPGELVTVTGEYRRGRLEARRLERSDGQVYLRAPRRSRDAEKERERSRSSVGGPRGGRLVLPDEEASDIPPQLLPAQLAGLLEAAGYRQLGRIELHPRHYAVEVLNPWNERVEVHLDFDRRIYKERRLLD
ncbi:MAG: hypothetical protein JJT85_00700 [Chromatiales bacterium]|nr:hypothetical protein [Chromatiales bacterium]